MQHAKTSRSKYNLFKFDIAFNKYTQNGRNNKYKSDSSDICLSDITRENIAAQTDHNVDVFVRENVAPVMM